MTTSIERLQRDSFAAGFETAAGTDLATEPDTDREAAPRFARALTEGVAAALSEAREAGQGPRQLAAGLSRVYRAWRTDEAERRVRDIGAGGFHQGLLQGLAAAGSATARWVVAGRGCATCREAAAAGEVKLGEPFEDAVVAPPAHPDCGCTLIPG